MEQYRIYLQVWFPEKLHNKSTILEIKKNGAILNFTMFDSVLNVKALVGTFNQKKALVGAFSVIVNTDGSFAALV